MKFSAARSELDSMVVEIELTLVSIIQGVALTILIENAHAVIAERQLFFWLYVVAGLFIIFVFWSRAVLHILTVIRWPLEFGHNFLYIACALVEAILFAQIGKPASWLRSPDVWSTSFGSMPVLHRSSLRRATNGEAGSMIATNLEAILV